MNRTKCNSIKKYTHKMPNYELHWIHVYIYIYVYVNVYLCICMLFTWI